MYYQNLSSSKISKHLYSHIPKTEKRSKSSQYLSSAMSSHDYVVKKITNSVSILFSIDEIKKTLLQCGQTNSIINHGQIIVHTKGKAKLFSYAYQIFSQTWKTNKSNNIYYKSRSVKK